MLVIRLAKLLMVGALAAFAFLVTYDNIVDYGANYQFVQHVLSMDTTFPDNALKDRAVTNPQLWKAAYGIIIAAEGVAALLLTIGAVALLIRLRATAQAFNHAKAWAVADFDGRVRGLVLRLFRGGRRIFHHVAIARLERARICVSHRDGYARGADLSDLAGPRHLNASLQMEEFRMRCCDDRSVSRTSPTGPSRRHLIAGLASTAVLVADRAAVAASDEDEQFMRLALEEARLGDYPFGAVIVRDRRGHRARTQSRQDQWRSDRAWRNGGDTPLSRRSWIRGDRRQHALHVGRAVRDVHGRDDLVPTSAGWSLPLPCNDSPLKSIRS